LKPRIGRASRVAVVLLACIPGTPASAQLSDPCGVTCGVVLGTTGVTFATGALVAYTRHTGGVSTPGEGLRVFAVGLATYVGGAFALSGNGARQERAVYGAGIGALAGSAVFLAIESTRAESDGSRKLAALLMGAAAGSLAGGVYSALSHDTEPNGPLASISLTLDF
jgi:hypothetical protein